MSKTNNFIFWSLYIVAWFIFVGLSVEAGAMIVNFIFSLFKPEIIQNLYQKLDLSEMYKESRLAYFSIYGFILTISILKACLFYIVISLMHKMDLLKPFSAFVAKQISLMSYFTLAIGLIGYAAQQIALYLSTNGLDIDKINQFWPDSQAFVLMAAVIYIIAIIFSRGVEIQKENELTV